jgi:DNA-3-methyladenine glycosylase II
MPATKIKETIRIANPGLSDYLDQVTTIEALRPKATTVVSAVTKIVVGQMLSRKAANSILERAESLTFIEGKREIALLSTEGLRSCGISNSKAKAIKLFADQYYEDCDQYENWRNLGADDLFREVKRHWGLSDWTASMLAIFYLGLPDVYPVKDGSIKRVTKLLEQRGIMLEPEKAAPYRSYLALYLWKILDKKLIF